MRLGKIGSVSTSIKRDYNEGGLLMIKPKDIRGIADVLRQVIITEDVSRYGSLL